MLVAHWTLLATLVIFADDIGATCWAWSHSMCDKAMSVEISVVARTSLL